jgi:hypothetical protein
MLHKLADSLLFTYFFVAPNTRIYALVCEFFYVSLCYMERYICNKHDINTTWTFCCFRSMMTATHVFKPRSFIYFVICCFSSAGRNELYHASLVSGSTRALSLARIFPLKRVFTNLTHEMTPIFDFFKYFRQTEWIFKYPRSGDKKRFSM